MVPWEDEVRWLPSVLLLGGCPFVFGQPDLSNVGAPGPDSTADTDVGTTLDTDLTTDTGAPSDTADTPPSTLPQLSDVTLVPRHDGALLVFTATDPEGVLDGGELRIDAGQGLDVYRIPDDLEQWNPGQPSSLALVEALPCAGFAFDLQVTVRDAGGDQSHPVAAELAVRGFGVASETGDAPLDVGLIEPPTLLCSTFEHSADVDQLRFEWPGGPLEADLAWDNNGDVDLFLETTDGAVVASAFTVTPGEHVSIDLAAGSYVWSVEYVAGGQLPTTWSLLMELQ